MINKETVSTYVTCFTCFVKFDLVDGFTHCPADKEMSELLSIRTDQEILKVLRCPQGHKNAVAYFQQTMQSVFKDKLYKGLLIFF